MHRSWGILTSAIFAVALEVTINLIAASVAVPRKYYFVPIGAFVVLVGLQFVMAVREQQTRDGSLERSAIRLATGGKHIIRGAWHKPSDRTEAAIWIAAVVGLTSGLVSLVSRPDSSRELALIITCCCAVLLSVLCLRVALGDRVSLEFSADGVAVRRGFGRKRRLRWDEAKNFEADGDYFFAEPTPSSTWYLNGWDFDDRYGVILICEMYDAGFHAAAVNAAVEYWKKTRSSSRSK
jgi:hypothetical protein